MGNVSLTFGNPWYLALLGVVPILWWAGRKSLSGMSRPRAIAAAAVRTAVLLMLVLALAETKTQRTSDSVSVLYVLDQSLSIPADRRQAMFQYVARSAEAHRDRSRGDRAGVIVFGRDAAIEAPPLEHDLGWLDRTEALPPDWAEATNLAAALKLALATLPADSARRVVIVTDGNQNIAEARQIAPQLAAQGIGIDVVPVPLPQRRDIAVEKIVLPTSTHQGETVEARVVIANDAATGAVRSVNGKLRVARRIGSRTETLIEQSVELEPGKNVFPLVHTLDDPPGFYTYEAQFIPDDPAVERTQRNNRASAFTSIRGKGRVLLIENADAPGDFDYLVQRLRAKEILVDVATSAAAFDSLAELQSYDTVVLANVPRISGDDASALFTDEQIDALVRNTEMGCGLVMLGGPNSFGAGGWANTRLEEVSPVNFQVKNAKVVPSGALALVIDKSGSMTGEKILMSRRAAIEAVRVLGAKDHIGVIAFDGDAHWIAPMQQLDQNRDEVARRISRLAADGGTDMYPGMREGFDALRPINAAVKHMIVLSDGQTQPSDFGGLARRMRQANITVSTVAIGAGADRQLLASIAQEGGGKFYQVTTPAAIPRIFIKEAMRVARPLIYEREEGFSPQLVYPHEMLRGIEEPLPPIRGFVLTDVKQNPLVEVSLLSPRPNEEETATVLASWTYGLGRFVVFTTDAGNRWASDWTRWPDYDALFTQIVRWSMRPREQEGEFIVSTEFEDGKIRAIVTALDEEREFLNFLNISCAVATPELDSAAMPMEQTAPGRYVGELAVDDPGSYFLSINPGQGGGSIVAGVNVPYSAEFDDKETNWPLLQSLASQAPAGGEPGMVIQGDLLRPTAGDLLEADVFRPTVPPAISVRDIWPTLALLAACVFFFDVLVRRIAINPLAAVSPALAWLRRRRVPAPQEERMERLRHRKAAIEQQIDSRRAASRFEANPDVIAGDPDVFAGDVESTDAVTAGAAASRASGRGEIAPDEEEESSYTSRLLAAKRRMQRDRSGGDA